MRGLFHGWIVGCAALACGSDTDKHSGKFLLDAQPDSVAVSLPSPDIGVLRGQLESAFATRTDELAAAHAVQHLATLSYDPLAAGGLDLIEASPLSLDAGERAVLGEHGFVISPRREFPTFAYGYASIYAADLPVFISADMLLEAVHRSYDAILAHLERTMLRQELAALLASMRARLASGTVALEPSVQADVDLYLTVADSLLADAERAPLDPSLSASVRELLDALRAGVGEAELTLFGVPRQVDTSQFQPRGHYAGEPQLASYFRAMVWLGRTDFRLLETLPDGSQVFRPRQLQAALALSALLDAPSRARYDRLDHTIGLFVGEHDDMTIPELDALLGALGVEDASELMNLPGSRVAEAIASGGFGEQRIASRIMVRDVGSGTYPLDSAFAFFGQRYTVDSHVFSNLVYDRVGRGAVPRVIPNPLDVAFAALGNDQALALLGPELARFDYAGDLSAIRLLVDAHPTSYWQSSLYTSWLSALRSLAPTPAGTPLDAPGLPEVMRTETWGRRLLNTQLASWAELRHDTVAYAKQSYTAANACEFPDAYVDPYPEFFRAMSRFAELGRATMIELGTAFGLEYDGPIFAASYFEHLGDTSSRLAEMAEFQRTGQPHTPEQLDYINAAVQIERNCDGTDLSSGWYSQLHFKGDALTTDPTVADVHTDPGGVAPPRDPSVLHVGTGNARLMVVTRETCAGPRAYAGMVFSYYELQNPGYARLDDEAWQRRLEATAPPADVPWMTPAFLP